MFHINVFTFNPFQENTYILYTDSKDAIIIDPGCYFTEEQETLLSFLNDNQLNPVMLLNTHCHLDHVFGNMFIHKQYGLELHLHTDDEVTLKHAPDSGKMFGLDFNGYTGPLHYLSENQTIKINDDTLKIFHTPGHSPGSISFYCEKQGFVISGDVLFRESIGRTDVPGGDFDTLINSIRTKLYTLPGETIVYSGHGGPTTIQYEIDNNPYTG